MILDDDARLYLRVDWTLGVDPTGGSCLLEVIGATGSPYAMTLGTATSATAWDARTRTNVTRWAVTAQTTSMFVGSARAAGGDVQLAPGDYAAQPLLTLPDGQIIPGWTSTLTIR